jgi:hypothetical protein
LPKITEVKVPKLREKIDPQQLASQQQGREGKGMNEQDYNEMMSDFNMGVDITELK